jgi:hypothetical protein
MSEPIDDGGHAYPTLFTTPDIGSGLKGMTLRDWFAGQAMQGMLSNPANYGSSHEWRDDATVAEQAYEIADDMIKARKEKQ